MTLGQERALAVLRRERWVVAGFLAAGVGRAAAQMGLLFLVQRLLAGLSGDRGGAVARFAAAHGQGTTLALAAAALFALQLAASACSYAGAAAQLHVARSLELGLTADVVGHLLRLGVPYLERHSHGDLVQAVRQDVTRVRLAVRAVGQMLIEAALLAALLGAAFSLAPRLGLLSLLAVPAGLAPLSLGARRVLRSSYEARRVSYALADVIHQILRGARVIRAFRAERAQAEQSLELGRRFFAVMVRDLRARALGGAVLDALAGLVLVSIIVLGGREVLLGRMAWPALLAFVMAVRAMYGPLHNLHAHALEVASMGASAARISEILAAEPEVRDRPSAPPLAAPPRRIAFERVSFSYGGGEPALRAVDFVVHAGETIGVVGPSGGGKSTLLALLARFHDPTAGRVTFDGRDLRDIPLASLYESLAVVTQETFLFGASVRDNLRVGRPAASQGEIEAAARAAYIHEEILALPEGYDTRIGLGGRELSGGQRQRIGVARALLADAPILLLDEATSSLDSVAEAAVQRAVEAKGAGRTCFVVAHRLSTLRRADRVLVLEGGRVVGLGPHRALLATCPTYRRLWEAQRLDERPASVRQPALGRPAEEGPAALRGDVVDADPIVAPA